MSASVVDAILQSGGTASAQVIAPSQYTSPTPNGSSLPLDDIAAIGIFVAALLALFLFYMLVYRNRGGGGSSEGTEGETERPKEPEESASDSTSDSKPAPPADVGESSETPNSDLDGSPTLEGSDNSPST